MCVGVCGRVTVDRGVYFFPQTDAAAETLDGRQKKNRLIVKASLSPTTYIISVGGFLPWKKQKGNTGRTSKLVFSARVRVQTQRDASMETSPNLDPTTMLFVCPPPLPRLGRDAWLMVK